MAIFTKFGPIILLYIMLVFVCLFVCLFVCGCHILANFVPLLTSVTSVEFLWDPVGHHALEAVHLEAKDLLLVQSSREFLFGGV